VIYGKPRVCKRKLNSTVLKALLHKGRQYRGDGETANARPVPSKRRGYVGGFLGTTWRLDECKGVAKEVGRRKTDESLLSPSRTDKDKWVDTNGGDTSNILRKQREKSKRVSRLCWEGLASEVTSMVKKFRPGRG